MLQLLKKLGPGLIFAGAAIGVSHLVQATKAGASYGLGLLWAMLLVTLFKYPSFLFGAKYPAITKQNLLQGYHKLGKWIIPLYSILNLATMFTIQTCVTIVTASIASGILGIQLDLKIWSIIIIIISALILCVGKFSVLDNLIKVVVISLSITTVIAVIFAFFKSDQSLNFQQSFPSGLTEITFLIAFMGWMPGPLDISIWQSLWTQEKIKNNKQLNKKTILFDFNIGYVGTLIIGVCFLLMGALIMFNSGTEFSPKGSVFANQFLDLYGNTLGNFARFFIGIAALTCMFSTTITTLDASPRAMEESLKLLNMGNKYNYIIWIIILSLGTAYILFFQISEMGLLVKVATVISFLTAPIYACLNHLVIFNKNIPKTEQPHKVLKTWSILGILFLLGFSIWYLTVI